jgi:type I restriction enzyme, R subunit
MTPDISERAFEDAIEASLLRSRYNRRTAEQYDRTLCLLAQDVLDFVLATQPKEWARLALHHGASVRDQFLKRVATEINRRGTLDVLRQGIKDSGCKFRLAYFQPASGLNKETQRLHEANLFAVVRQLRYSTRNENSLDLVLFLNGIPLFTAELKNPLSGQNVKGAIDQYRTTRDPREPLLAYGRCLGHFAVDSDLVYVASQLAGPKTRFLPFNQGSNPGEPNCGAGNPPVPPTRSGYATAYLWEQIWAPASVLDLARQFIHEVEEEDDKGRKIGKRYLIFPRFQQLDAVRRLVADARSRGPGQRYLIQHSAGSGKSFTIAWLAHQLSTLHNASDQRVFDSIVVITDRRILDRQLQSTIRQFEQTLGVVETIDTDSRQLKDALESGKTIIVTTLQKFPVIAQQIGDLPGKRFAVIVDEAHSSQSGESTKSLKAVLRAPSLEAAERVEQTTATPEEELENTILAEMEKRGHQPNVSTFAFTATPKPKTLELFGVRRPNGSFGPIHLYSMRQAIEEGFILDVLANYTTYQAFWRLLKKVEDDPRYDKRKAEYLLKSFVELHPHAIGEKIQICVEHFAANSQDQIDGLAKAMFISRSRLHAVRYKLAIDRYLSERGFPFKALVAFSGTVQDGGKSYTESNMNGIPEAQTASTFQQSEYRFLIVANKFQTGFDQPLLHTMYVDKKLGGVGAVQTLSRLNRTDPRKAGTLVVDFANDADAIQKAFEPYYEATLLSEATDPNLVYEIESRLSEFPIYSPADINAFAQVFFNPKGTQDEIYKVLLPLLDRFEALSLDERHQFRGQLTDYVRLYAFLAQVLPFKDVDLEKLYQFARYLRRLLPSDQPELPLEVQQNIDMESYRIQETSRGAISLQRGNGVLNPAGTKGGHTSSPEELETLSRIVAELNEHFGLNLGPEHRLTLGQMMDRLADDVALDAAARVNTRENVRLTFDQKVEAVIQDIVESNFDLYKLITDDAAIGERVKNFLFDQYLRGHRSAEALIKRGESKTLEFKSTLRWNLKDNRKDDKAITHAALKTIAAFLNTEGGDLLIGVADDGQVVGLEPDQLETDDKFLRHLAQVVRNGLGDRAGTCIDPNTQSIDGKTVCVVSCQRSPEPVFLRWKGLEATTEGDLFVRSGPGTVKLPPESAQEFIRTRFAGFKAGE